MAQEKLVDIELGSVFSGTPLVEKYVAKTKTIGVQQSGHDNSVKCVLKTADIPFDSQDMAQQFIESKQQEISENLAVVANPYLVYSVNSQDNILHPCRSVYVKYGIIIPTSYTGNVPLIIPKKHTSIRYDISCTGFREVEWITLGKKPNIQFQLSVPENIKLPNSWCGKPARYAFLDCVFFFEEIDFAREFRDDMLMQQALRRYALYGKIEKTW